MSSSNDLFSVPRSWEAGRVKRAPLGYAGETRRGTRSTLLAEDEFRVVLAISGDMADDGYCTKTQRCSGRRAFLIIENN